MKKEYIICPAIYYTTDKAEQIVFRPTNTDRGLVVCGYRHNVIINQYFDMTLKRTAQVPHIEGFLTSKNRFVNRAEAALVAHEAGQIDKPKRELFSHDLY